MSRPPPATYKTMNWPAYNEALKRRGSLKIWFDPEINWNAAPNGKLGRQQTYSDAAIQTCLSMKVLFGMALRQTTGFVESLLRLVGLDWAMPDFSTLSRRQKTLAVNIPYRGSKGPLHLLIDSTGIRWRAKANGTPASTAAPNGGSGARSTSESTRKRWRFGPSRSPQAISATRQSCPICSVRSRRTRRSAASPRMVPMIPENAMMPSQNAARMLSSRRAGTRSRGRPSPPAQLPATKRSAGIQMPRARFVAKMERLSPPEPRRNENALSETLGAAPHAAGL